MVGRNGRLGGAVSLAIVLLSGLAALAAAAGQNILKPTNKVENWRLEQHEQAKATIAADGDTLVLDVTTSDDTDWHIQAFQVKLDLKNAKEYLVSFKAKADAPREMKVQAA